MTLAITQTRDIAACHAIRRTVFIVEQGFAESDDLDGLDETAIHLLAAIADEPVGTARLLVKGDTGKIGRVSVLPEFRGRGIGKALILKSLEVFAEIPSVTSARLSAQADAISFYEPLGFQATGEIFMDAGAPHRDMVRPL
jgi:predicted GNAT family N-acyltransferase